MTVFFDTETVPFRPGCMAPKVVCLQWCYDYDDELFDSGKRRPTEPPELMKCGGEMLRWDGRVLGACLIDIGDMFAHWLEKGETVVGHNVAFDCAALVATYPDLMPLVWQAYREDRIHDTMFRQKLADIGRGRYRTRRYDLGSVSAIHGGPVLDKEDEWRTRYNELIDVPLAQWPEAATKYALNDALATRAAYLGQEARYDPELLVDACSQARKFWALQLTSVWGIRTSARGVASLREGVEARIEQLKGLLVESGLLRPNGTRDTKAAKAHMVRVCDALGVPIAMTKGDDISLSSDACDATEDELLKAYTEYASMAKTLSTDVPMLERGLVLPLHSHFDLVESGRTSSAKPNIQNIKRNGLRIREAFVPRGFDSRAYELDSAPNKS